MFYRNIHNALIANGTLHERVLAADIYTGSFTRVRWFIHQKIDIWTKENEKILIYTVATFSDVSMSAISLDLYMI